MTPFDPTNREQRPVMTPDGRGWLSTYDPDSKKYGVLLDVEKGLRPLKYYRIDELQEVEK
jgi:hypothetical protein